MVHMKLQILFHNIQEKKRWMHSNISDIDGFKLEKFSAWMVHCIKWPFPIVRSLTFLRSTLLPPLPRFDSSLFCSNGGVFVYLDTLHPYRLDKTVVYVVSAI